MKKLNIQVGIVALCSLLLVGCSEDFMNKQPSDQLSSETFYKSKGDFDMALTACYGTLQNHELYTWSVPYMECMTDNGYTYQNYLSSTTISQGPVNSTSGGIDRIYNAQYKNIVRYNIFLKNLDEYVGSDITESEQNQMGSRSQIDESYFLFGFILLLWFCTIGS